MQHLWKNVQLHNQNKIYTPRKVLNEQHLIQSNHNFKWTRLPAQIILWHHRNQTKKNDFWTIPSHSDREITRVTLNYPLNYGASKITITIQIQHAKFLKIISHIILRPREMAKKCYHWKIFLLAFFNSEDGSCIYTCSFLVNPHGKTQLPKIWLFHDRYETSQVSKSSTFNHIITRKAWVHTSHNWRQTKDTIKLSILLRMIVGSPAWNSEYQIELLYIALYSRHYNALTLSILFWIITMLPIVGCDYLPTILAGKISQHHEEC